MWPLAPPRVLFVSAAVMSLLLGSIADFLVRSPGDASLLLVAFLASAAAALLLSPGAPGRPNRHLPDALRNKPFVAFALFAFASTAVFAKIAEDVVEHESSRLDRTVSLWVHAVDNPALDSIMKFISFVGAFPTLAWVAVIVLTWCWFRKDRAAFVGLLGVVAVDETLNRILKNIFDRPRPTIFEEIATLHSYSFPSGHAMAAVANYGMMAVVVGRLVPPLRKPVYGGAVILALWIGLSRIYLGVHWVTDVLAGYAAGGAILFAGVLWLEAYPANRIVYSAGEKRLPSDQS
jgi:membrane-associated phospholipid phosphatase